MRSSSLESMNWLLRRDDALAAVYSEQRASVIQKQKLYFIICVLGHSFKLFIEIFILHGHDAWF